MENLTDRAWRKIFKEQGLDEKLRCSNSVVIDAKTIKKYRECRLMTKFDHSSTLPHVFRQHNVNILPLSKNQFLIGKFNLYKTIDTIPGKPTVVTLIHNLKTLPTQPEKITSEQTALACAYETGILAKFAKVSKKNLRPTLSGRMGTGIFSFSILAQGERNPHKISVDKAQMEIDAVYETPTAVYLIEAKNHTCEDFIIRQLYYPYRYLRNLIGSTKQIIPVFMKYVDGTYYLYQYKFTDINRLDSISYVDGRAYSFVKERVQARDVEDLLHVRRGKEPDAPFPQADTMTRVEDIMNALSENGGSLSFQDIIDLNLDFTARQADYYINAGKYLGLYCKEGNRNIVLTRVGARIQAMPYRKRKLAIAKRILSTPVFSVCYKQWCKNCCSSISKDFVAETIKTYRPNLSGTTPGRRFCTVKAWLKWIKALANE